MIGILTDRSSPYHRQAGAVHVLRLPNLCDAIALLNDAKLFDEAVTMVRVMAELAINVDWIGTVDARGKHLALDAVDAENRGDRERKEHFGIEPEERRLEAKPMPNVKERAKQAGPNSMKLYAGVYQWGSGPTHSAFSGAQVDDVTRDIRGRRFAMVAVQAAKFLAVNASRTLGINDGHGDLQAALDEWTAARD